MALCLVLVVDSMGTATGVRPDLAQTNLATCPYVVQSGAEYTQGWNSLGSLTIEDAQIIAPYIGLVWAVAWTFRVIARFISTFPTMGSES